MMAVVGAASLAGAVTHTLSSSFIVLEMTSEYSLLIPCTVCSSHLFNLIDSMVLDCLNLLYCPN
jgi:H+/Cl- antiporter ClcA